MMLGFQLRDKWSLNDCAAIEIKSFKCNKTTRSEFNIYNSGRASRKDED